MKTLLLLLALASLVVAGCGSSDTAADANAPATPTGGAPGAAANTTN